MNENFNYENWNIGTLYTFFNPNEKMIKTSKECHLQTGWPNEAKRVSLESLWKTSFNEIIKIKTR